MRQVELTDEERAFLLNILSAIQISGNPDQVREMLAMIDAIRRKLEEVDDDHRE